MTSPGLWHESTKRDTEERLVAPSLWCVPGASKDIEMQATAGTEALEKVLKRRRKLAANGVAVDAVLVEQFDYSVIEGRNCENVIGYVPVPLGVAGPVAVNGREVRVPIATTEGCLVASIQRGTKAIGLSGGVAAAITQNGMTRAPCVRFPSIRHTAALVKFVKDPQNFEVMAGAFESTSKYARLVSVTPFVAGRLVYLRVQSQTGDAMGMNIVSKGCEQLLEMLGERFPEMEVIALSGNVCADKKAASVNWVMGRGRSVTAEAVIPEHVVEQVLHVTIDQIVECNSLKNHVGSAVAGALGGFNAHAANVVAAIFAATGQDIAQVVESSACLTIMEKVEASPCFQSKEAEALSTSSSSSSLADCGHTCEFVHSSSSRDVNGAADLHVTTSDDGSSAPSPPAEQSSDSLYISVTLPCLEVGTVGGGTHLPAQSNCIRMLQGALKDGEVLAVGESADRLAEGIAAAVLAGELSLMAALAAGHLVDAHMRLNRGKRSRSISYDRR